MNSPAQNGYMKKKEHEQASAWPRMGGGRMERLVWRAEIWLDEEIGYLDLDSWGCIELIDLLSGTWTISVVILLLY